MRECRWGLGKIFYRRRRRRVKRKSGNIDDFCRRWGGQYSYMVVLDADSVMSGDCLTGLVRLMEANPKAGIIQSSPKASGMDTLYARMPAVRHPRLRPAVYRRPALLAAGRIALLGPQRDHPREALHRPLCPGAAAGRGLVRRLDPVPRLRGSGADAPCRLGRLDRLRPRRDPTKSCRRTCWTSSSATAAGATAT